MVDPRMLSLGEAEEEEEPTVSRSPIDPRSLSLGSNVSSPPTPQLLPADESTGTTAISAYQPVEDAGFFTRTLGSALVGAYRSPVTKQIIQSALGTTASPLSYLLPQDQARRAAFDETVDKAAQRIENSPNKNFVKISELIGEWGPELTLGGGAMGAGRAGAVRGLQEIAPTLSGRGAIGKQMARVAFKSLEDAGEKYPRAVPLIQQGAEVLGEAIGLGGFVGIEDYLDNGDITEATRSAALTAAIAAPAGVALRGLGKIPRKGRERNPLEAWEGLGKPEFGTRKQSIEDELAAKANKTLDRIQRILKVDEHAAAIAKFEEEAGKLGLPTRPGQAGWTPELERLYPKRTFTKEQIKKTKKARTKLRQQRQAMRSFRQMMGHEPLPTNVVSGPRPEPSEIWEGFNKFLAKTWNTPETFFGRFGKTFGQFGELLQRAEVQSIQGEAYAEALGHRLASEAASALGMKGTPKNGLFLRPLVDAYEKGNLLGVRNYMNRVRPQGTERMLNVFRQVEHSLGDYRTVELMGAEPMMNAERLAELDLPGGAYWPQQMRRLSEQELESRLASGYMKEAIRRGEKITPEQAQLRAKEALDHRQAYGFTKSGTIDHNRIFRGSLQDKLNKGMPFEEDPIVGLVTHLSNVSRRMAYGKAFGFKGELANKIPALVEAETNAPTAAVAKMLIDHFLNRPSADVAMSKIAESLTSLQIGMKLPLSVIKNLSQTSVTAAQAGAINTLKATTKGLNYALRGTPEGSVLRGLGLGSHLMGVVGDTFMESAVPKNALGNLALWTLKYTGFNFVERFNRLTAGAATQYDIMDTFMKAWRGRLKGRTLDAARRRMADYGLNLGEMIQRARRAGDINAALTREELEYAVFRGSRSTQFIPSQTRKPLGWQNREWGRVLTQFKTFGLNYGRFLKDRVLAEAGHGNYKPLITFFSVSQPTGEFVMDLDSVARGRQRPENAIERMLDNQAGVGGLGLLSSTFTSARYGGTGESILGPTVGGAAELLNAMRNGQALNYLSKQPIVTLIKDILFLGIITEDFIDRYLEADGSDSEDKEPIPIQSLIEKE